MKKYNEFINESYETLKIRLEREFKYLVGKEVEVDYIGNNKFCISYLGNDIKIYEKLKKFLKKDLTYDYDEELDETFCRFSI